MDPGRLLAAAGAAASLAAHPAPDGPAAIAAANRDALTASAPDKFEGGVQVFAYAPGRIYEIWAAPLRVSALTLSPGETVVDLAAGDTVRWKIGVTHAGEGEAERTLVLVKPLETGLETNLVLTTSARVYLIRLRAGPAASLNAQVAWTAPPKPAAPAPAPSAVAPARPLGALDAGYAIMAPRRRPPWTPLAVMTDGVRTYIAFSPRLAQGEAPALFALGPGAERRMVNFRLSGELYIVDEVLERAELVDGGRRPRRVEVKRVGSAGDEARHGPRHER